MADQQPDYRVQSIAFEADVVVITYVSTTDVRVEGLVGLGHQIQLSMEHPDYAEDADLLHRQAVKVLKNALEDWSTSLPWEPDDDDNEQMGG